MADTFPRTPWHRRGYHVEQVEDFLRRGRRAYEQPASDEPVLTSREVRTAAFDLVLRGYDIEAVDAALDRLEDALAGHERRRATGAGGSGQHVSSTAALVRSRLERPDGERFPRGERWEVTYDPDDVDELCRRLAAELAPDGTAPGVGSIPWGLSPDEVRRAVFRRRRGRRGYRESAVDAFLDRVVDALVRA